jgi:aminopeptidase N
MARAVTLLLLLLVFAEPARAQRLPTNVTPVHYDITVAPDLAAATFAGDETIRISLTAPSSTVVLNAAEITFEEVSISANRRTQKPDVKLDAANEQATFSVPAALPAGEAEIRIKYTGILNDQLRGLYLSKANNRRYAVTQLEATDARRMFPSFDEPAYKATFALTAIVDDGDQAISNGAIVSDAPGPTRGKHTVKFEATPRMSTYLVALAVGDFVCNEGAADGIPIRICSTPDKKALTGFALESAQQIMRYYNRYYSIAYPFKKLDVVAVPDFAAGAMENTAAIFYRETLLLADEKASVTTRRSIATVLAHEMAHQWFGDLVTMRWWDDIWLNEGFANWMETKPVAAWKPEWHMELVEISANQTAMNLDALPSTRSIRTRASTPAEISELFDPIAYEKGAAVLRMVESWAGPEAFRTGVNAYVEKFKYGNAAAEDFWGTLAIATGKPVDRVMATFVDKPGLPLVNVDLSCQRGRGSATLTQERYGTEHTSYGGSSAQWQIPVCVRTASGKTICEVLAQERQAVAFDKCQPSIVTNAGARGYYRTALSAEAVRSLAASVSSLEPAERIAAVSDEWALVKAGGHDVGSFLDLASGFAAERTAQVMTTLTGILSTIDENVTTDTTRPKYRAWVRTLLATAATAVGWSDTPTSGEGATDDDDRRALRATVIAALGKTGRDAAILAKSRQLVEQELASPGSLDPTLLNVVVNLAALEGGAALYEKYLARSQAALNPEERYRYLYGLANFSDPALARRTMDYALGPDVRSQDTKLVIAQLLANEAARDVAWHLLRARWDDVQRKTGEFVGNTVIVNALSSFCDSKRAEEIKEFFATHKVPDAERTLSQALDRIRSCAALAERERPRLAEWLQQHH